MMVKKFLVWVITIASALYPALAHATSSVTALSVSSSSVAKGTAITLTATVTSGGSAIHPGTVSFCDASFALCRDMGLLGQAQLTSSGIASFRYVPGLGSHSYKAIFAGTTTYSSSTSSAVSLTVTGRYTSLTAIAYSGSPGVYTLTGTVTGQSAVSLAPTGNVSFADNTNGNYLLGSAALGAATISQTFVNASTPSVLVGRDFIEGDFNGDGVPDFAIPQQNSNSVAVYLGNGDGTFTAASGSPLATGGSNEVGVAAADFNNDGNTDLAVTNYGSGTVSVFLGNGDGTFGAATQVSIGSNPEHLLAADVNHDGNIDLVACNQSPNTITILFGNGSGGFPSSRTVAVGSGPYSLVIDDFNGDGNPDIAVANSGGTTVTVLLGTGAGTFSQASGSPITVASHPSSVVSADLNGDGIPDLVLASGNTTTLNVLLGVGNGTFTAGTSLSGATTSGKQVAVADFNGDGKPDVISAEGNGSVSLYTGVGDGTFKSPVVTSPGGSGYASVLAMDVDGDGLPDVLVPIQSLNIVGVSLNHLVHTATASVSSVSIPGSGSHNIFASYPGDANFLGSNSPNSSLTASMTATSLALQAAPSSSNYGQQVVLTATLNPYAVGSEITNGESITFYNGGTSVGSASLSSGVASLNLTSLPVGTDSLTASFAADTNFLASSSGTTSYVVSKATPVVTWAAPSSIVYGTPLSGTQLNATSGGVAGAFVYTPASGTLLATGANQGLSVVFTPSNATNYNSASALNSITVTQASGTVALAASSTTVAFGSPPTLTATVPSAASGTVTFKDGATTLGTGTIASGSVSLSSYSLNVGSHTLTASWPGDGNYTAAVSAPLSVTVTRAPVIVAVASSLNPSLFGDAVTFTLQCTGSSVVPTGTLVLKDGSSTLTTLPLNAAGSATVSLSSLTAGTHALQAVYSGDTNYQ